MSGILHLPQGGAQIAVISQIPDTLMNRDATFQEVYDTLGTYTYVYDTDDTTDTVDGIWDGYESWEQTVENSDMAIVNKARHNGLNFLPQAQIPNTQTRKNDVKFMFINRVIDFASDRVISTCKVSEANWTSTVVNIYLIPFNSNYTVNDYLTKLNNHLTTPDADIVEMTFTHNGVQDQNDLEGIMLATLPIPGKYLIGIKTTSTQNNAAPSIYSLQFRTY